MIKKYLLTFVNLKHLQELLEKLWSVIKHEKAKKS